MAEKNCYSFVKQLFSHHSKIFRGVFQFGFLLVVTLQYNTIQYNTLTFKFHIIMGNALIGDYASLNHRYLIYTR